jgi:hypothetical protein
MQDPSLIEEDPGFLLGLDLGEQAVQRSLAQRGELGSGREAIELQTYAQSYAGQYLQEKERFLANLAGANIPPSYLQAAQIRAQEQGQMVGAVTNVITNTDWSSVADTIGSWF